MSSVASFKHDQLPTVPQDRIDTGTCRNQVDIKPEEISSPRPARNAFSMLLRAFSDVSSLISLGSLFTALLKGLSFLDRFLAILVLLAMIGGVLIGYYVDGVAEAFSGATFEGVSVRE